jgi:hypothetical protein
MATTTALLTGRGNKWESKENTREIITPNRKPTKGNQEREAATSLGVRVFLKGMGSVVKKVRAKWNEVSMFLQPLAVSDQPQLFSGILKKQIVKLRAKS